MGTITLGQAAAWCGGKVKPEYQDISFFGANNDSRSLTPGQLFVALRGARDGHDFIPAALKNGAAAVLCTHCEGDYPAIVVPDTRIALGDIARHARETMNIKVVGVTGSVGKSTTKEMIACALQGKYRVEKSPVNHNNDIGLPMTVLGLPEDTEVAVLEMGMNHFREMAYLSQIAKPDMGVIINIGTAHIEHLGSQDGILKAKMEILEGMAPTATLILNGDDPRLQEQKDLPVEKVIYFGISGEGCDVHGTPTPAPAGSLCLTMHSGEQTFPVTLPVEGDHYMSDALAAVTVALEMGVEPERIRENLANFRNMSGRQEIVQAGDYTLIKDYYNASPESMEAALNVLGTRSGRRIAVLGDMLELGISSQAIHYRIGRVAAEKADILLAYGTNAIRMIHGAVTGGMSGNAAQAFTDRDRLTEMLCHIAKPGDTILFKGSRGMRMELVMEGFLNTRK